MARLKNRKDFIPWGFQFVDAAIDPKPLGESYYTFDDLVKKVQARRLMNPRFKLATDLNVIADEVDAQNAARLKHVPNAQHFIIDEGGAFAQAPPTIGTIRRARNVLAAAGDKFANYKAGVAIGFDWFGSGLSPVDQTTANHRAQLCSTCPQNQPEDWMTAFAAPAVERVKQQIEAKALMKLETPDDVALKQCKACDCILKLKVWTPMEHILPNTSDKQFERMDPNCWILAAKQKP